jgi:hypothetical protein
MDLTLPKFLKREKSIEEIEESTEKNEVENRNLDSEISILQKRIAIKKLKEQGLSPSAFSWDWKRILNYLGSSPKKKTDTATK